MQNYIINYFDTYFYWLIVGVFLFVVAATTAFMFLWRKVSVYQQLIMLRHDFQRSGFPLVDIRRLPKALDSMASILRFYKKSCKYAYIGDNAKGGWIADLVKLFFNDFFFNAIEKQLLDAQTEQHVIDLKEKLDFDNHKKIYEKILVREGKNYYGHIDNNRPVSDSKKSS